MKFYKNGFTLAETLVTLVIVGVISAITLGIFNTNMKEYQFIQKLKKSYSLLSQVTNKMKTKNSAIGTLSVQEFFTEFKSSVNYGKVCEELTDCFSDKYSYPPDGSNKESLKTYLTQGIMTQDGIAYAFGEKRGYTNADFNIYVDSIPNTYDVKKVIAVDLNGKAKPNVYGYDMFFFVLINEKIVPTGTGYKIGQYTYDKSVGYTGTALKEGKIDY